MIESMVIVVAVVTNKVRRVAHKHDRVVHDPFAHIEILLCVASSIFVFNLVHCRATLAIESDWVACRPFKKAKLTLDPCYV